MGYSLDQCVAAMGSLHSEYVEAMGQLCAQYHQEADRGRQLKLEGKEAAAKLHAGEKRKQQKFEDFSAVALQEAERC